MRPRITGVKARLPYLVELEFTDGTRGTVDLARWIVPSQGVFAALKDPTVFSQVRVDREAGTIVWPNGADLDPDVLYETAHGLAEWNA